MDHLFQNLYHEIVEMKNDLEERLQKNHLSPLVKKMAEEELSDLETALRKMESGSFGYCEETGNPIPAELLVFQPTVRSISEVKTLLKYFKKPVFPL